MILHYMAGHDRISMLYYWGERGGEGLFWEGLLCA